MVLLNIEICIGTSIRAILSFLHSPMLAKWLVRVAVGMDKQVNLLKNFIPLVK